MRDNYIETIKEYIKQKPQYKETLDQLKKDVLAMGGTEAEFEEAIRRIENGNMNKFSFKLTKKRIAISIGVFVFSIFYAGLIYTLLFPTPKTASLTAQVPKEEEQKIFPIVYASSKEVDADKVFSIPAADSSKLNVSSKPKKKVFGFMPYWMMDKENEINVNYLSDVAIFGLTVNGRGEIQKINGDSSDGGWQMWNNPKMDDFISRAKKSKVKVYLTFKSFNNSDIEQLSKNSDYQQAFISNAMFLVNSKNLDGINLDFEYTGIPSQNVRDGFTTLVEELNSELKREVPGSVLSIDTYLTSAQRNDLFDFLSLNSNTDYLVVMGYDMHTPLGNAGPVSAMGGDQNLIAFIENYLEKTDSDKIILAVPYYGYDWPDNKESGLSVKILPYAQIADTNRSFQINWDEISQTPYYSYMEDGTSRTVHFDNVRSLGIKYDFINNKNLAGVGIWALGYDGLNTDLEKLIIDKFGSL